MSRVNSDRTARYMYDPERLLKMQKEVSATELTAHSKWSLMVANSCMAQ